MQPRALGAKAGRTEAYDEWAVSRYGWRKRDQAYSYIRRMILARAWHPGQAINVDDIAKALGMSRTPVQEAIGRLEHEGFIRVEPQVGAFVRVQSPREMFEKLLARAALEGLLAERAAERMSSKDIGELEKLLKRMQREGIDAEEYAALNRQFHRVIHRAACLPYIQHLVELHWDQFEYSASAGMLFGSEREASIREHREIIECLRNRQAKAVRVAMERHVARVAELFRNDGDVVEGGGETSEE